eukprot:3791438-Pleurochrysis_carterae.AAC.2
MRQRRHRSAPLAQFLAERRQNLVANELFLRQPPSSASGYNKAPPCDALAELYDDFCYRDSCAAASSGSIVLGALTK